jgi:hypothetical protein
LAVTAKVRPRTLDRLGKLTGIPSPQWRQDPEGRKEESWILSSRKSKTQTPSHRRKLNRRLAQSINQSINQSGQSILI